MPVVFRKEISTGATLVLWRVSETEEQLRGCVTEDDVRSAGEFASAARRLERLAWRAALREVVPDAPVRYDANGAPGIEGGRGGAGGRGAGDSGGDNAGAGEVGDSLYVSAAHTRGMAAVLVSARPCAVDVEHGGRDLSHSAARFVSQAERELPCGGDPHFEMRIWTAKEAMYKISGRTGLDFLHDLKVVSCDSASGTLSGRVCGGEPLTVETMLCDGFVVAYIVE